MPMFLAVESLYVLASDHLIVMEEPNSVTASSTAPQAARDLGSDTEAPSPAHSCGLGVSCVPGPSNETQSSGGSSGFAE